MKRYTRDQQRAADYIVKATDGNIGGGTDPVGFLIASHHALGRHLAWYKSAYERAVRDGQISTDNALKLTKPAFSAGVKWGREMYPRKRKK